MPLLSSVKVTRSRALFVSTKSSVRHMPMPSANQRRPRTTGSNTRRPTLMNDARSVRSSQGMLDASMATSSVRHVAPPSVLRQKWPLRAAASVTTTWSGSAGSIAAEYALVRPPGARSRTRSVTGS